MIAAADWMAQSAYTMTSFHSRLGYSRTKDRWA
jgi:hypothetical protein